MHCIESQQVRYVAGYNELLESARTYNLCLVNSEAHANNFGHQLSEFPLGALIGS